MFFPAKGLPNFPCLGFMQLLDDGALGICQAKIDDSPAMVLVRLLTNRPGYVSNPVIDSSRNQIVYSHCVGPTKVFGPSGSQNPYYIRTAHSRVGAVVESLMPGGYMTTTIRTHMARRQMTIHQAKAVGTLFSEKGCRTKLVAEVCGDVGKLLHQWDHGWHRVTVYGDVKEPLIELGNALGFEVLEEA